MQVFIDRPVDRVIDRAVFDCFVYFVFILVPCLTADWVSRVLTFAAPIGIFVEMCYSEQYM